MTKIWAHRGASGYAPENTLPAYRMAVEMGADGIELDVHLSHDGELVVIHDECVDRTSNGTGWVKDMTLAELKRLDFSMGKEGYEGVTIPTLREVYELIKPTELTINAEIKCDVVIYRGIWEKLIALERELGMDDRILYSSFNHYVLQEVRKVDPASKIGLLYSCALVDPWVYANYLKADALHPHYLVLQAPGFVEGCKKAGVALHPWTVNDPAAMQALLAAQVEAIITNYPDMAKTLRDQASSN